MPDPRALKLIDSSPQKKPHVQIRTFVGLFINKTETPHINRIHTPWAGPGDNKYPTNQTDVFVLYQLRISPLQPVSHPIRSSSGFTQTLETNKIRQPTDGVDVVKITKGTRDKREATWRQDTKLVRVPKIDPSIQLSG